MKQFLVVLASSILCLALTGCANMSNRDVGTITGGVLGGALGNQIGGGSGRVLATVGGTLIGAYIGGSVGQSMDDVDRMRMSQAFETTRTNQASTWRNPDSGNTYTVTPTHTYTNPRGQPCREYSTTAIIGGKRQEIYGTACRQADGSWKVIK